MGRTIRSATQTWIEEEKALGRFARALRKEDQRAMMELINLSRLHIAESSYASNLYPMDVYLISMLWRCFKEYSVMKQRWLRSVNMPASNCRLFRLKFPNSRIWST